MAMKRVGWFFTKNLFLQRLKTLLRGVAKIFNKNAKNFSIVFLKPYSKKNNDLSPAKNLIFFVFLEFLYFY